MNFGNAMGRLPDHCLDKIPPCVGAAQCQFLIIGAGMAAAISLPVATLIAETNLPLT
ncbi:hypothetical protein [Pedosphaera parvula]|uniref:Uncharacterized protein n=1 Tax=Pedosphaera parvula (strain Ellin514) TaxID=320771 RepID=B9XH20_PEDPL|nr:hypothetical protein [Pedosphaera parvula]EEF60941.1 hypothetical protein Cflav_PD4110 [Pedosphaera parvula Ellin514]